jgi:hypothetical protein
VTGTTIDQINTVRCVTISKPDDANGTYREVQAFGERSPLHEVKREGAPVTSERLSTKCYTASKNVNQVVDIANALRVRLKTMGGSFRPMQIFMESRIVQRRAIAVEQTVIQKPCEYSQIRVSLVVLTKVTILLMFNPAKVNNVTDMRAYPQQPKV